MRRFVVYLLVVAGLVACGGDGGSTTTAPAPSGPTLTIEGRSFGQAPEVAPGESFTVSNLDGVRHTVTSPDGLWDEVSVPGGSTATFTVPADLAPGTYSFVCTVHPDMGGTLTVSG